MTEFTFIRHGETDWNRQLRFQGHADIPLNATGLAQAQRLGEHLSRQRAAPRAFYCSDLIRAQQTAAPLATAWSAQPQLLPAFREQSFGILEGLDAPTIKTQHAALWAQWLEHQSGFALPGGESLRSFHGRVMGAVDQIAALHPGVDVLVVTHGGVLDMLWRTAQGLSLDGLRVCDIPNTGVNRVRWHGGRLEILEWANAGHLAGMPEQPSTAAGER